MTMRKILAPTLAFLALGALSAPRAQGSSDLYMPAQIRKAYAAGTRSRDGRPGPNYFQNRADYRIQAEFFPETSTLAGQEVVAYRNNSRDALEMIYFNLYQNYYKKGTAKDADVDERNLHDGVEVLSLSVNGAAVDPKTFQLYSTILGIRAPAAIPPGAEARIEVSWRQKMPVTAARRYGTHERTNFFLGYWYPKVCVYDDIEGWNRVGHRGSADFYADFGNFDAEITAPAAYTVWSSGELLNAADLFPPEILLRLERAAQSDEVVSIIGAGDRAENRVFRSAGKHVWKFRSRNRTDFAFALSDTYVWDGTSVPVGDARVRVYAAYDPAAPNFRRVAEFGRKSIAYYSSVAPAIPYPDQQLTVFQGGHDAMEFPGLVYQQEYQKAEGFPGTSVATSHEIGHAYLPFLVGVNEQKYGWMDEGLISLVGCYANADIIGDREHAFRKILATVFQGNLASQALDVPVMLVSYNLGDGTCGYVTYLKSAAALALLYDYLGQDRFCRAVREFVGRWQGKHPTPYDFFFTVNEVAGQDLAWFWKPWFFEFGYADLGIGRVEAGEKAAVVDVERIGAYPVPVTLKVFYRDGSEKTVRREMDVWKAGARSVAIEVPGGDIREITLNGDGLVAEDNRDNNRKTF